MLRVSARAASLLACVGTAAAMMVVFAMASPASAGTLVIGAPGDADTGNCFPFGCSLWEPQYQQVYASTDFSGALTIGDLVFYNHNYISGPVNSGTYTISLSTTSAAVNGLNTSDLSDNIGANNTVVFNASLPSLTPGPGGELVIPLSTRFTYNPGGGNLLMNVYSNSGSGGDAFLDALNGDANGLFSRAMTPGCCGGTSGWGLVTGFTTAVPEPSTWAMLLIGFTGLGFAGYHASRRSSAFAA